LGSRRVLGLADGDDDPTCAEHGLVNILEAARVSMDKVLREMMDISEEQAAGDAEKIKAMRTCVGWFSSPVCALIYQASRLYLGYTYCRSHLGDTRLGHT